MASPNFSVVWNEDSGATVLGRMTARNGTGSATGVDGEGNWLKQADISTITCKVIDLTSGSDTAIATPTVTISSAILDTPVTSGAIWKKDTTGYNFIHDLASTNFPTGGNRYAVEYTVTLTGGTIFHAVYQGPARPIRTS